jgi:hypothetical protein
MTSVPRRAERLKFLTISCLAVLSLNLSLGFIGASAAEMGDGHNMPTASLGDREATLMFNIGPSPVIAGMNVDFDFKLMDNKTGNNISHVTYLVVITRGGQRVLTESMHTHDGNMKIQFVPGATNPYKIYANYDGLSASYVSDFGNPIKVSGPIFVTGGNYTVSFEITGVDFDNVFLPTPIKFNFPIPVAD